VNGSKPRVVILGAGFGGLYAARALKKVPVAVTVVDRRNHHLFQPLLYQVATAALAPGEIAMPIRAILRNQRNAEVFLADAQRVDAEARKVVLRDGEIPYDYLIIATGGQYSYFGHPDWERIAPGLKSLEDALDIRRRILYAFERAERETSEERRRKLLTFVIIGGGPTGVEMAGAIAEIARQVIVKDFRHMDPREARVILLEAGPRVLATMAEELSQKAEASLRKLGAEVHTNTRVTGMEHDVVWMGDQKMEAATILWAAGIEASPLVRSLGAPLDRAGRVIVEPDLSIPGHREVFVIGDASVFLHQTGAPLPGMCPVAIQQGRHVAENIRHDLRKAARTPFHYFNKGELATIGRSAAVCDFHVARFSGFLGWMIWLWVHIFFLIGFENRVIVMLRWAWSYFTSSRAARLITGDIEEESEPPA
jgi:NADH:quinone reductase (non-electrogenic)